MTLHQLPIANKERVIIVGAGIGGLAASLRLSHMGYNVKVFETAETAGGKLRTITGQTGEIDIGPTVLTLLPVFQKLFRSVGEDNVYRTSENIFYMMNTRPTYWGSKPKPIVQPSDTSSVNP